MIPGAYPRLFGSFKEGAIITTKFVVGGGGAAGATFAQKLVNAAGQKLQTHNSITLARTAIGVCTLQLKGFGNQSQGAVGALDIAPLNAILIPVAANTNTSAAYFEPRVSTIVAEGSGSFQVRFLSTAGVISGSGAELALTNGDEVHFTLYVGK